MSGTPLHDASTRTKIHGPCCVCGYSDTRGITTTRLASGEVVVVCGTHELMHRRTENAARTVFELRRLVRERRETRRRGQAPDELGARLSDAFMDDRRSADRRGG